MKFFRKTLIGYKAIIRNYNYINYIRLKFIAYRLLKEANDDEGIVEIPFLLR